MIGQNIIRCILSADFNWALLIAHTLKFDFVKAALIVDCDFRYLEHWLIISFYLSRNSKVTLTDHMSVT